MKTESQANVTSSDSSTSNRYRWGVFFTLAVTYFLVFSQRTAPGLITDKLMQQFQISAATLGVLAGIQYFAYMGLQIPLGFWADRVGPNLLLFIGSLLDGIGTILYSLAPNAPILMSARLLVGIGDAMIWINIVLVLGRVFRAEEFASILGWTGMSGSAGALATTVPLTYWIAAQGWRVPFFSLGMSLCGCAVLIYFVLLKRKRNTQSVALPADTVKSHRATSSAPRESGLVVLKKLSCNRQAWATFLCHFGLVGTYISFIGSWAVPYSMTVYGVNRASASEMVSLGLVGALVGGPIAGWLTKRMQGEKSLYVFFHALTLLCWVLIVVLGGKPPMSLMMVLFVLIGLGNGSSTLTFAIVRKSFPLSVTGVASGFANTGGFLSAVILPTLFGLVLQHFGVNAQSGPSHTVNVAYQYGFLVPAVFSLIGLIGGAMVHEEARKPKSFPTHRHIGHVS